MIDIRLVLLLLPVMLDCDANDMTDCLADVPGRLPTAKLFTGAINIYNSNGTDHN